MRRFYLGPNSRQQSPFGRAGATCNCGCEKARPCAEGRIIAAERERAWAANDMPAWEAAMRARDLHLGLAPAATDDEARAMIDAAQLAQHHLGGGA